MNGRLALACAIFLTAAVLAARADDEGEDERVHEWMERTHQGRRSPYGQLRRIVAGPAVPWPVIEQTVAGFDPMCRALLASPNADIKGSAEGYVDAVKEIVAATRRRDAAGLRTGLESLTQSCGDCHFDGGSGGELEDEDDEDEDEDRRERRRGD